MVFSGLVKDTVNRTGEYRLDASGKGINVSRLLAGSGRNCRYLTHLGGVLRPLFLELCARDGLRVEWVESSSPLCFCYSLINTAENSVTELVEEAESVGEGTEKRLLEAFSALVPECGTLIISGPRAPGFSDTLIPEMVRQARAAGCRIILDACEQDLLNSLPCGPLIIKSSLYDFVSTFAPELVSRDHIRGNEADIKEKIGKIWTELPKEYPCALVLRAGTGSVWYAEKGEPALYCFEPAEPHNAAGSEDAFTAGLAAALDEGASLGAAVARGSA